ncbi:RagB/SusD family nutrient uptake outer membrane protein [Prevotella sp. KH2C16]|uniref:RagB/SusD family nutrient uptake outer membrane protein n=1 Tax=Prevotella sp. KH2C16 TaxID=1855325 RepID=UPI0008ED90D1|nr:RagB/SusD family nutrient uptake outer membrane protein [Prevotella sp. KH2C16]SFG17609.1 Starch-binding associating with outer membrane [Prevotella sp. KH2C16]
MKTKYSIMACLLAIVLFCSCNDSFLQREPTDRQSDGSFWKTAAEAEEYVNGIYLFLVEPENHTIMTDCYTDNAVPVHVGAEQGSLSAGTAVSSNPHFKQLWDAAYAGIRRCQVFYQHIGEVPMDDAYRAEITGEVQFLEAFFYSTLLKYMGGVPIVDHPLALKEPMPARATEEETYNHIVGLLDKAAPALPDIRQVDDHGKPSAGACYALKARLAFYAHKYDEAEKAAKKVMDMGKYGLYDDYAGLFQPVAETCNEIIFDREYLSNPKNSNEGSWIGQFFAPIVMGGWEALSPTQDMVDAYPCTDGKSIKESPLYDPAHPFANRDPRLAASILHHGDMIAGHEYTTNSIGDGNHTRTGYCMRKYMNPENDGINNYDWTNFIFIRYAEVLLTYAEARNEQLAAPDKEVYDAVNAIRQRKSVNLPRLAPGLSKDEMRAAIRLERRLELAFEGIHLFDTRSYKTTEAAVTKPVYGMRPNGEKFLVEQRKFNPARDYLWAIPLEEIDLSKGVLKQNPNWD